MVGEAVRASRVARPPRAMAWVLVLGSAAAVLIVGIAATIVVVRNSGGWAAPPAQFWPRLALASLLTVASLGIRSLRWIFLLRRAEIRIPIRDAYVGYLSGLSLLFAPFLLGEIAVRALVLRRRGQVPVLTTAVVNVWERAMDLIALAVVAVIANQAVRGTSPWTWPLLAGIVLSFVPVVRLAALSVCVGLLGPIARLFDRTVVPKFDRLLTQRVWTTGFVASVSAWLLPGLALWVVAGAWSDGIGIVESERIFAVSAAEGGLMLAPGGVLVVGPQWLQAVAAGGIGAADAALIVLAGRLATVGVSIALGAVFCAVHARTAAASSETHFDDIADAYDVQIPEGRRLALLERKTALMREEIEARRIGRRGLDVGCGQGAYVERMRSLGFDVRGIDSSPSQIAHAGRRMNGQRIVTVGSVLEIPAEDASLDFVYTINVLHHLPSVEAQRQAFAELERVLVPGGLLFVHEINTRNLLFRFHMGYVFPSLNCIDEGIERWLLPHRLSAYTQMPVAAVRYFTFLPEFLPAVVVRWLRPLEALLERSALRVYSAHYMGVLQKSER